jgi:hypothetical protein
MLYMLIVCVCVCQLFFFKSSTHEHKRGLKYATSSFITEAPRARHKALLFSPNNNKKLFRSANELTFYLFSVV